MVIREIINRRSVRNYKKKEVSDKDLLEIIKAAQFAPTAHNNRSVEFIIIKNQNLKNKIYEIVGQEFVKKAPVLIVPTIDTEKTKWPTQDLSLATGNIFLQAEALGLGTVWKNLNLKVRPLVIKLLRLPKNYAVINLIPVGYPSVKKRPHDNRDFKKKKIYYEQY